MWGGDTLLGGLLYVQVANCDKERSGFEFKKGVGMSKLGSLLAAGAWGTRSSGMNVCMLTKERSGSDFVGMGTLH